MGVLALFQTVSHMYHKAVSHGYYRGNVQPCVVEGKIAVASSSTTFNIPLLLALY